MARPSSLNRFADGGHWPSGLDRRTICLSVDVEWAADTVIADIRRLLDERDLRATFFCTHAGTEVGAHERGLHPNYRRNGDTLRSMPQREGSFADEIDIYRHVLGTTREFAPEAKGVRSHSLYFDSLLLSLYPEFGLEYDSSYQIPLVAGLRPFWKEYDVLAIPIYFADHFELKTAATGFSIEQLRLDEPGLKVINLHPNIVFTNATSHEQYLGCKGFYHDCERLLAYRHRGRGIRTMIVELLDDIAARRLPVATLGEVNAQWRGDARRERATSGGSDRAEIG
jgi:peptidoglycan/xylan/chitin deacetylase (PgdA/CDA1 family)